MNRLFRLALESSNNPSVRDSWKKLEAFMKKHHKEEMDELPAPATHEEIHESEKAVGHSFPHELVELLKIHNGQGKTGTLMHGFKFLSTEQIPAAYQVLKDLKEDEYEYRQKWWNEKWLPFARAAGSYACTDTSSSTGEVMIVWNNGSEHKPQGMGVSKWMATYVADIITFYEIHKKS